MMMKTLRSFLAVFLCAVLMMGSFTAGAAIKEEKAFSGGMYLPVHFPDDSVEYYSAKVVDGEIYLSPEDIAAITGYQYDVEDYMAFSKPNEYGAMVSVDVTFDGETTAMGRQYSIPVEKEGEQYALPLEKLLYLTHATWCVEDGTLYVSPLPNTIFDFMSEYYDDLTFNKVTEEDILLNGESELLREVRSALVHFISNLDGRFYFISTYFDVYGTLDDSNMIDTIFETDYEKLLMMLLTDDSQFLGETGQEYISSALKGGAFSGLLELSKNYNFLSGFIDDSLDLGNAENIEAFLNSLPESAANKLEGGFPDFSKLKAGNILEWMGTAGDVLDVASSVASLLSLAQTAALAETIQEDTISQLSILTDMDKIGYNKNKADKIQQAAKSLVSRADSSENEKQLAGDVLDWLLDFAGSALADANFAGKTVNAIQAINTWATWRFSSYADSLEVGEISYYAGKMVELEYVAQTELAKIVSKISPVSPDGFTAENIEKLRNALLLSIRLNIRSLNLLYQLQEKGSDTPNWTETEDAEELRKKIGEGYAMLVALESTNGTDQRLLLDSFDKMFNEEPGLTRQNIPTSVLVPEDEIEKPLTSDQLTWLVEPTWDYEVVEPIPGPPFSDIVNNPNYGNGIMPFFQQTTIFPFAEMSFPFYSNLPEYYRVMEADGNWQIFYMPRQIDTKNSNIEIFEPMRYDNSGIAQCSSSIGGASLTDRIWDVLIEVGRGGANGNFVWDSDSQCFCFFGNGEGTSYFKKAALLELHKPYPVTEVRLGNLVQEIGDEYVGSSFEVNWDFEQINNTESLYAYASSSGTLLTDFIYNGVSDFSDGLAACSLNGEKWGYIDETGNPVTDFVYEPVWLTDNEITPYSDYWYKPQAFPCTDDTMVVKQDGEYGLLYRDGSVLIGFGEFESLAPSWNNQLWAKQDGKWGLIDLADAKEKAGLPVEMDDQVEGESMNSVECSTERDDRSIYNDKGDRIFNVYFDVVTVKGDSSICTKINQQLERERDDYFSKIDPYVQQKVSEAAQAYDRFGEYRYSATAEIMSSSNGFLSVRWLIQTYQGGAHGGNGMYTCNFDLRTGKKLKLEDMFSIKGAELRSYLRQQCFDYISQHPDNSWLNYDQILNQNQLEKYPFYIQNGTVYIQFAQYELAAGAAGPVSIPCPIV